MGSNSDYEEEEDATMYWFHDGSGWWLWLVMPLVMMGFWGLLIWGVVTLVRGTESGPTTTGTVGTDPAQILAERFARGEIDADEYERRLATLQHRARPAA